MAKRKCKVCGTVFEKQRPLQFVCSPACGIEYRRAQFRKAAVKAEREAKREERAKTAAIRHKLETIPELTKKAQAAFNRYIRLRDRGKPCISCGAPWKENFQACHYVPAGRSNKLRFDEQLETDHETRKWTKDELRELTAKYKQLAKEIEYEM